MEIDFSFSSSGYLDVSVHRVPFLTLIGWGKDDWSLSSRVSPFRYLWITAYLQLPKAFRSLSRLSSALSAKASTLRSCLFNLSMYSVTPLSHAVRLETLLISFMTLVSSLFDFSNLNFWFVNFSDVLIFEFISFDYKL